MSEFWVSKKKYFCKYCETYIADDAPSRTHHESGMRHKGNLERYIRSIYKTGEKHKKDADEERREMARVEQLANAAYAEDIGAGRASAVAGPSSAVVAAAASKRPSSAAAAAPKAPSDAYANYSTAASLGYTDPDAERIAREEEMRRSQGIAGEWQILSTTPVPKPEEEEEDESEDVKPDLASIGEKRPADQTSIPHDEDTRSFKIRKRTLGAGLGEIYDPGLMSIKVKKRPVEEETVKKEEDSESSSKLKAGIVPAAPLKLAPISLKPGSAPTVPTANTSADSQVKQKEEDAAASSHPETTKKWAKVAWGTAEPSGPMPRPPPPPPKQEEPTEVKHEASDATEEETKPSITETPAPMFKKRKAPASSARGRRQL